MGGAGAPRIDLRGKFVFDTSRWPVFVIAQVAPHISDEERVESFVQSDRVLAARPGPYAIVLDNRVAGSVSVAQRKLIAEHMAANAERTRERCRRTGFVLSSAMMRGTLTAIMWLRKPMVPTRVFSDLERAVVWCEQGLHDETTGFRVSEPPLSL